MSNVPLIQVEDLHIQFNTYAGVLHAVNGISFEISRGEVFGLVGETGCGKSVTGLSLLGLIPKTGKVRAKTLHLEGDDLLNKSESEWETIRGRRIAMVFQDPSASLNPVLRIRDQIIRLIRHHKSVKTKAADEIAKKMLSDVGLPDVGGVMSMYPHELSGGMQQRVMIAMALSLGAELLIADEPTTALDVTIQAQILDLMTQLAKERGLSIMLITHNLGVVAETCDRAGVLYAGNMVEIGPTERIFKELKHPYTRALLAAIPGARSRGQRLPAIPGSVPTGLRPFRGCAFATRCSSVMEICRTSKPVLVSSGEGHHTACHLYEGGSPQEDT